MRPCTKKSCPTQPCPASRRQAGFTLLEILVALVVLGLLMAGLTQGVRFGVQAWDRQTALLANGSGLEAVDRALRRLVEEADPGSRAVATRFAGDGRSVAFIARLGHAPGAPPGRLAEVRLAVEAGVLVLRWVPHRHAIPMSVPATQAIALLPGVERIELSYWGAADPGAAPAWQGDWQGPALPRLVRLRLVFPQGSALRWPDIVAAPRQERATR